jgi:hypothetical protein
MPELLSHSYFLPTNYVFSRDQGLTCETQIWQDVSLLKKGLFHPPIRVDAEIEVTLDGQPFGKLPVTRQSRQGISYVHFQSTSSTRDSGLLIESVRAEITHP